MIETLRLEGIAIVDSAELELGPGLNVLTGETGAGKSIVLGALSLLVGAKASPEVLRDGCEKGRVEAVFRFDGAEDPRTELEERGLETDEADEETWIVARTLQREGRSRARVAPGPMSGGLSSRVHVHDTGILTRAAGPARWGGWVHS